MKQALVILLVLACGCAPEHWGDDPEVTPELVVLKKIDTITREGKVGLMLLWVSKDLKYRRVYFVDSLPSIPFVLGSQAGYLRDR